MARKAGAVIENGGLKPHPDGKGGWLYKAGFVNGKIIDNGDGPAAAYQDDHGKRHLIPVQDIRRVQDANGKMNYHFMVDGRPVSTAEGDNQPFQTGQDGRRYTQAADGTRRDLGYDRNAAAQAGVQPRVDAARKALDEKMAQGQDLARQVKEKQAQADAAQQRLAAAQQAVTAADQASGPDSQTQRIRAREERLRAEEAVKQHAQDLQALQKQHDEHYRALNNEMRARQADISLHQSAAAEGPQDEPWRKDARSMQGAARATDLQNIAAAEKKDPAAAAALRQGQVSQPTQRLFDATEKAFATQPGQSPAEGKSMTLHEMLMQAPAMTQGKGDRQTTVDQAAAARATAQGALGISDPENVRVTRGADGSYTLTRKAADGSGADVPFATLDPKTNRITLKAGADGRIGQHALDMAARSTPGSTPVYLPGGQPPMSESEISDLIQKGTAATASAKDRKAADAALTQAGLSPEGIGQMVQQGRLSVQDGQLLNNKFNSGVSSYAQRDKAEAAQQHDASLQQISQDSKGTKDKPNFGSWMDKGDPVRDAQVRDMAQKMGVSEDAVRRDLETRRLMDWGTPSSQASHDQQSGVINGLKRGLGLSGLAEPTRTLPDGTLMPNPQLGADRAKFDAAIDAAQATPEAKAKAKELWGQYHDNYLTGVRSTLETMQTLPGVENYMAWRERMQNESSDFNHLSENQKAEKYMEEQKGRPWYTKLADTIGSNLIAGSHDLVSGIAGTAGLLTGSQTLSDFAAEKAGEANRSTAALQYTGSDGLLHNIVGGLARAAPGLAAAAATGGAAGGTAMAFVQGAGSTYADLYQHGIDQGLKPEEAHRAAAGAAITSGAVSAALGKIMPGGAQALNNPATREAAKKSFGTVLKSALKGAAEEIPQEVIDGGFNHIATEMAKGKTFNEAATSYAEQFPQSALTAALLGGATQAAGDHRKGSGQDGAGKPPAPPAGGGHVEPGAPPPRPEAQGFTVASVDGPDVSAPEKPGPGVPITPTAVEGGAAPGPEAPSSSGQQIPQNTTKTNQGAAPAGGSAQPPAGAPPASPAVTLKDAEKVLGNIERLKEKQKAGKLSLDEQRELAHSENVVALTQVANLEAEQQVLRKLPQPRELDPAKAEALEKAREVLKRPWPGGESATTSTQSSGGSQLPGSTATANGDAPATGHATGAQTGTGEDHGKTGTGGRTTTASSGGTTTPATESGSHTTNGVAAPPVGHGNTIPENTTSAEHIDLARKRAENLEETARKRPLTEHERKIYDNARRVLDRNSPAAPGSRKTGDAKDLVMAGGDGPATQTQGAAADAPPPAAPAQPANAVGTTIEGQGAANPDGPRDSANSGSGSLGNSGISQQQQAGPSAPAGTVADTPASTSSATSANSPPATTRSNGGTGGGATAAIQNQQTSQPSHISKSGLDELQSLPALSGKTKAEIEAELIARGYTSTPAHSGGTVWTKPGNDGITSAVRIDPAVIKKKPKGWADEVPHVHKETVPTSKVDASGNYGWQDATTHNDAGFPSTDKRDTHIPGGH